VSVSRHLSRAAVLSCLACGWIPQTQAAEAACKPIVDADKARAAATSWHSKKAVGETSMEMIRLGDDIYANLGRSGWRKMPPGMVQSIAKASDGLDVSECKKLGSESVAGVATTIYSFKTTIPGQPPFLGKVWIGDKDGLPYREVGDKYDGTMSYTGVVAPALK
jgi:hypothetical protein